MVQAKGTLPSADDNQHQNAVQLQYYTDQVLQQFRGCHSQGKGQGKKYFFKIMEKSGNFATSQ